GQGDGFASGEEVQVESCGGEGPIEAAAGGQASAREGERVSESGCELWLDGAASPGCWSCDSGADVDDIRGINVSEFEAAGVGEQLRGRVVPRP
ncbi:MAG: hypothetical protein ACO3OK_07720, partial [Limisphaerales bacterium]